MPIIRGFVERLEIGRAGLVTAALRHDDGSTADYLIQDLDADPERFNERLSKLGVLRDAMARIRQPVERRGRGVLVVVQVLALRVDVEQTGDDLARRMAFLQVGHGVIAI